MKYIKFGVTFCNGKYIELVRSYKNNSPMPPCPHQWAFHAPSEISTIVSNPCSYMEKHNILRRRDHIGLESIIDTLENACFGKTNR